MRISRILSNISIKEIMNYVHIVMVSQYINLFDYYLTLSRPRLIRGQGGPPSQDPRELKACLFSIQLYLKLYLVQYSSYEFLYQTFFSPQYNNIIISIDIDILLIK